MDDVQLIFYTPCLYTLHPTSYTLHPTNCCKKIAKHLHISEKKCTLAAKKRTKQPVFLGKSGQNAIQFLEKSGQHKQNTMINRQLDNLIKEHLSNSFFVLPAFTLYTIHPLFETATISYSKSALREHF